MRYFIYFPSFFSSPILSPKEYENEVGSWSIDRGFSSLWAFQFPIKLGNTNVRGIFHSSKMAGTGIFRSDFMHALHTKKVEARHKTI